MRRTILVTVVLLVGLLAWSGASAAAATQISPDTGASGAADSGVGTECIHVDFDGDCDYCWDGDEYIPC